MNHGRLLRSYQKRNEFESDFFSCYGFSICQKCIRPFHPQQRASLTGHRRCSVAGCTSAERYCLACSSAPCRRCFSPLCAAHEAPHEIECYSNARVRKICGYDIVKGIMHLGIKNGCCGKNMAEGVAQQCFICHIDVCSKCLPKDTPHRCPRHVPGYDTAGKRIKHNPPIRIRWGAPEYCKERQRRIPRSYQERLVNGQKNVTVRTCHLRASLFVLYHMLNV